MTTSETRAGMTIDDIRHRHQQDELRSHLCYGCGERWPCDAIEAANQCDAALARLAAAERVVESVRERVETEGWCIACGGDLERTFSTDDNPEGLEFRHREGCALVAYDASIAHTPAESEAPS